MKRTEPTNGAPACTRRDIRAPTWLSDEYWDFDEARRALLGTDDDIMQYARHLLDRSARLELLRMHLVRGCVLTTPIWTAEAGTRRPYTLRLMMTLTAHGTKHFIARWADGEPCFPDGRDNAARAVVCLMVGPAPPQPSRWIIADDMPRAASLSDIVQANRHPRSGRPSEREADQRPARNRSFQSSRIAHT